MAVTADFDPSRYYELASRLMHESQATEAALRTGINRFYLACMLAAQVGLMRGRWQPIPSRAEVRYVDIERELRQRGKRSLERGLHTLRQHRVHADYHLYTRPDETNDGCDVCSSRHSVGLAAAVDRALATDIQALSGTLFPNLSRL